jgi:hypothetical protein
MQLFVLLNRRIRPLVFHFDPVPPLHFLAQVERFLELVARVEVENWRLRCDLGQHVDQHHAFRAEGRGHRELRPKAGRRPAEDVLRLRQLQAGAGLFEFFQQFRA